MMPNKKNCASCFSLPRCLMTKVLRHPPPKSSREGGRRHRCSGPAPEPAIPRPSSPSSPAPTQTHQVPHLKGKWVFLPRPRTSPRQQPDSSSSGFFPTGQFKATAAQTEAKFFHKLAPVADAGAWVYEEHGEQSTSNYGWSRVKGKILYF